MRTAPRPPPLADGAGLAETRERFLSADPVETSTVRDTILASWRRSRNLKVAADRIQLPYIRDPEVDTPLTRSAEPVLRTLRDQLEGQQVSILLTDSSGLVLVRLTAGDELERHLDRVQLAPGFSYAEEFVGTNGIGTALEGGRPMHVFGHEHYAENLEMLACAGVPIHHPISGRTVGAVDLTCWRKDAGSLLMTLAKSTAEQIRQALLADTGTRELELLHEYMRVCRHTTGIVFALDSDVAMMNDLARSVLDPADQAALLGHAADALAAGRAGRLLVELPTGITARMTVRPVAGAGGGVVQVRLLPGGPSRRADGEPPPTRVLLPGLVGASPPWLRACDEVERAYRAGEWLAVAGEPGSGKLAVLRAVQLRRQPVGRLVVLDAADATDAPGRGDPGWLAAARRALQEADSVVVQHVDQLDGPRLRGLAAELQDARAGAHPPWVAVTTGAGPVGKDLGRLLRSFPSTVEIPALRHHIEDLRRLVPFFLARLGHGGQLTCSPEAIQLLMRSSWPGNVLQVLQVLRRVVQHRRAGVIRPDDLPPESMTVSRRLLNQLESMERDAIVQSLLDTGGNKVKAARALGMSRATIYRKIHEYGIVTPVS